MLSDELLARVKAEAERRWPHLTGVGANTNEARAVRRLTFRQGVEWAMSHTTDEDLPQRPYDEATDHEYGAWETDSIEEHALDMLAVVRHRRESKPTESGR